MSRTFTAGQRELLRREADQVQAYWDSAEGRRQRELARKAKANPEAYEPHPMIVDGDRLVPALGREEAR